MALIARRPWSVVMALALSAVAFCAPALAQDRFIVMSSTTSTEQSGLFAHLLPRFTGRPIRGGAWSVAQLACINAGLALFALGLPGVGGALLWLSLALFSVRLWPVLRPASPD